MTDFNFLVLAQVAIEPSEWLKTWSTVYDELLGKNKERDHENYRLLMNKRGALNEADFMLLGQWKDNAYSAGKWKKDVASVAFDTWSEAARKGPMCPEPDGVAKFLNCWSNERSTYQFAEKTVTKCFGLSRASTLLHFLSAGKYPIYDSRARTAVSLLCGRPTLEDSVDAYLVTYCPLFESLAAACGTALNPRKLDCALFAYAELSSLRKSKMIAP